jgi:hypothetical protein
MGRCMCPKWRGVTLDPRYMVHLNKRENAPTNRR